MLKIILLTLTITLAGCTTMETKTNGRRILSDSVLQIKPGITTRASTVNLFGNPTEITNIGGIETFIYLFKEQKTPTFFGGLLQVESRKKSTYNSLKMVIKDGIVISYKFVQEENKKPVSNSTPAATD